MEENNNSESIWIFAYGSLCWRPGFAYEEIRTGYVNGFLRRFWQGNVTHRGSPSKPGRVATLVPSENGQTLGCAYRIKRNQLSILKYLENREMKLGGYVCVWTAFFPVSSGFGKQRREENQREENEEEEVEEEEGVDDDEEVDEEEEEDGETRDEDDEEEDERRLEEEDDDRKERKKRRRNAGDEGDEDAFPVLCYIALQGNSLWLGEDSEKRIATQVRDASGECGSNSDYVLNLYKYMKTNFPGHRDEHLEGIVKHL